MLNKSKNTNNIDLSVEQRYKTLIAVFDSIEPSLVIDRSGMILEANKAFAARLGMQKHECIGKNAYDFIGPQQALHRRKKADEALSTGNPVIFDEEQDGRFERFTFTPIADSKGKMTQISMSVQDVTELFRKMFEMHSAIMLIIDPGSGRIVNANNAASAFYGWPIDHLCQMHIQQINTLSSEEINVAMEKSRAGEQNHFFFQHRRSDNVVRDVEAFSITIEIEGKGFLYSIIHDITERKLAENHLKKLSAAIEQSPAIVLITDLHGTIEFVNPMFAQVTGYSAIEVQGQNTRILKSGLMPEALYQDLWKTILSGDIWSGEMQNKKKNGELYWDQVVISAIMNKEGVITNFIAVIMDITEKKKMVDELIDAKEKSEESSRLKTAFLGNISHEIRTPMNGILGFSELLNDPHLSGEEQSEYLSLIQQSGERMLALINDLMDISKIDAGEAKLVESDTVVNQLLLALQAFFKPEADKKGLQLTLTNGLPDAESIVKTDSLKLNQILTNLIQNALKFTSKGSIDIGYSRKENMLEFYVIDSGRGIAGSQQEKIFERFNQADCSLTRNHEGSGLGLSIAKAFVEMLGGTIHVESVEGVGSTFSFTLPYNLNHPDLVLSAEKNPSHPIHPPWALPGTGLCILISDDDAMSTLLLQQFFKSQDITFLCAENGWEAVELVQHHPEINLVLMDIKMPIMNGYEATGLIKKQRPELPIIAQSAFTSKEERRKAKEAGCDDFITKPIRKSELLEKMHELLLW